MGMIGVCEVWCSSLRYLMLELSGGTGVRTIYREAREDKARGRAS
jgi:hypothetical protein